MTNVTQEEFARCCHETIVIKKGHHRCIAILPPPCLTRIGKRRIALLRVLLARTHFTDDRESDNRSSFVEEKT